MNEAIAGGARLPLANGTAISGQSKSQLTTRGDVFGRHPFVACTAAFLTP